MSVIKVKLYGEFALFNDVVANVERYSYPVPTFSAIRGILESIYWKPEFNWEVLSVQVLNEIKHQNFLRNEVISQKIDIKRNPVDIISNGLLGLLVPIPTLPTPFIVIPSLIA